MLGIVITTTILLSSLTTVWLTAATMLPSAFATSLGNVDGSSTDPNRIIDDVRSNLQRSPFAPPSFRVECDGQPATIVGTPGIDHLVGTDGYDVIAGLGADDRIEGRGGFDLICGDEGDDILNGNDDVSILRGGPGNDQLVGNDDRDNMFGGDGDDRINGAGGKDDLFGEAGDDILDSRDGVVNNDEVDGGSGIDQCPTDPDHKVSCEIGS